ncbi:unnamed protein product [Pieris macdunnoughi]|uniref:Uncharacterized protein n=1 Tax=Pieris macdunnoughi TaxID=345717 RepID=A0A821NQP5_9NEOP|nr:unnamed protein product [Pieris macdunnoughi]
MFGEAVSVVASCRWLVGAGGRRGGRSDALEWAAVRRRSAAFRAPVRTPAAPLPHGRPPAPHNNAQNHNITEQTQQ